MSGYDLKGMLSRARNQAGYVQNHILPENNQISDKKPTEEESNYHHKRNDTGLSSDMLKNGNHQFLSQNTAFDDNHHNLTPQVQSHVLSANNPVSGRD